MSDDTETTTIDDLEKTFDGETDEHEPTLLRTLPPIIEIYGSGRDPHTRHLRRAARFKRRAFRIGGIFLIRPGRRFDMTRAVARKHGAEIVERVRAGQIQVKAKNRPFTIEELEHGLLGELDEKSTEDKRLAEATEKLGKMAELARKLGYSVSEEELAESIEQAKEHEGEAMDDFLTHLDTQLLDMRRALDEQESDEEDEDGTLDEPEVTQALEELLDEVETDEPETTVDTETEPSEEEAEEVPEMAKRIEPEEAEEPPVTEPEESEAEEPPVTEPEESEAEEPPVTEPEESPESEEDALVPADLRLPEGYERLKKDDLVDLYVDREDYGLVLPEPKTEGKPPTNDQLVDALTEWALTVEFAEAEPKD